MSLKLPVLHITFGVTVFAKLGSLLHLNVFLCARSPLRRVKIDGGIIVRPKAKMSQARSSFALPDKQRSYPKGEKEANPAESEDVENAHRDMIRQARSNDEQMLHVPPYHGVEVDYGFSSFFPLSRSSVRSVLNLCSFCLVRGPGRVDHSPPLPEKDAERGKI